MDSTYLLAAVKTVIERNVTGVGQTTPSTTTIISSTPITINSRVQELLQTLQKYKNGPKYNSTPPVSYIKASTEIIFVPQSVDELSWVEHPIVLFIMSSVYRGSTGSTVGGSGTSTGGNASTSSGMGRTSSTSGSRDSRPQSLEDGPDLTTTTTATTTTAAATNTTTATTTIATTATNTSTTVTITLKSDWAGPIPDKESGRIEEKESGNMKDKESDKMRDEKEKEDNKSDKIKRGEIEKDMDENEEEIVTSTKRTSWRGAMRVFGRFEHNEPQKSSTTMRSVSISYSHSVNFEVKSHAVATVTKVHARATNTNNPTNNSNKNSNNNSNSNSNNTIKSKPFSYISRRSLEETSISTPSPLLPKPATLMQRSSSSSSISSMEVLLPLERNWQ
ncbi:hypothetical protein Glove_43g70 [Diversispora epigaea]|uniref:Uncharacterized protein n=1 Tax=Diversispora epigaea TaxID=1348612 RepID=A0A397JNS3_9GLOM|nr:hypothetical protein Glove_43g70 [Diversispora epigaea]